MANSFTDTPSGIHSPAYSGAAYSIARRSYASAVSGTGTSSNSVHREPNRATVQSHANNATLLSRTRHYSNSPQTQSVLRSVDQAHYISASSREDRQSWEKAPTQQYSNPFNYMANHGTGHMLEPRPQEFVVPSYLRGSKYLERLEDQHKARLLAHREARPGWWSTTSSLSTNASSPNIQKMIPAHRGMAFDVQEKHFSFVDESVPILPLQWDATDKCLGIEVLGNGLEIRYNGTSKSQDEAAAVRSDSAIPKQSGIYYFEVTILSKNKECQIGIGLSGPKVTLSRLPGWELESWAYHGDDGYSFNQTASGKPYGPKFSYSDVIGCGINLETGCTFYTKNGVHLGTAFRDIKAEKLHPAVGMKKSGEHVKVNFGQQPFIFDIDGLVLREKENLLEQINRENLIQFHPSRDASTLMPKLIAQYLAHEGYVETAKLFAGEVQAAESLLQGHEFISQALEYKEDKDAINRQVIRAAVLDGDIDRALKHTKAYYPSVLQENDNIYFRLRCRKFIEMIRKCTLLQPRSKRPSFQGLSKPTTTNGHRKSLFEDYTDVFEGHMDLDDNQAGMDVIEDGRNGACFPSFGNHAAQQNELMTQALLYGQELKAEFKDDSRQEIRKELEATFALIAYPDARDSSLAPLLEVSGRVPVAEELSSAILVSLGKSSTAAIERLVQQTEILIDTLNGEGGAAAFINVKDDCLR